MNYPEEESRVLGYWREIDAFGTSNELSRGRPEYTFYDGPPFATGLPHYGHILSGTIKDTITRFFYQQGFHVDRKFGWDCHGLPIEYEIDKAHGIKTKKDVERIGVGKYNELCRSIVLKYSQQWQEIVERMGRWIDFPGGYRTMDPDFMESVWWVFSELYKKGAVYRGYRVMPYSTRCRTPMSNFEANQNYRETKDLTATVRLPLRKQFHSGTPGKKAWDRVSLLIWTTTPWTLPSNSAVLVNPAMKYALFRDPREKSIEQYVITGEFYAGSKEEVLARFAGSELIGLEYAQPFDCFEDRRGSGYYRVYPADFVVEGAGTGLVHCAPGFGEDDYNAFVALGLIRENEEVVCPVDEEGKFTGLVPDFQGVHVKDADIHIIEHLKKKGVLFNSGSIVHSYPFCWRSDTPLIYKAVPSWFVRVRDAVADLVEKNKEISWSPAFVGANKFGPWLENAKDWAVSRNRYWGTPIPLWVRDDDPSDVICIGSLDELQEMSGVSVRDLHKDVVDAVTIQKNGHTYRRTEEVLDCWFESGSMPYAQKHYPFEQKEVFAQNFPADFIAEGLDQTRGWFYTLHVLSVLLFGMPAFKNVMVTGLVLASDGKKMSKRLKNYPDPVLVMQTHGADAMRLYLLSSPVIRAENLKFTEEGVAGILRELLIPWNNCLRFLKTVSVPEDPETGCVVEDIALGVAGMEVSGEKKGASDADVLDAWVLHELLDAIDCIRKEAGEYRLHGVVPRAVAFITDLSRWYIRLSRERLRDTPMETLRTVLAAFSVVMAPFAPFFSEKCYQETARKIPFAHAPRLDDAAGKRELSVHFQEHEKTRECVRAYASTHVKAEFAASPAALLQGFRIIKKVVESVRVLRKKQKVPLKMPLLEVCIVGIEEIPALTRILSLECNALAVSYQEASAYTWREEIAPDYREISGKYTGQKIKEAADAIRAVAEDPAKISEIVKSGSIQHGSLKLSRSDLIYRREATGLPQDLSGMPATDAVYTLINTRRNAKIENLWLQREVKSAVQKLRKRAGLQVSDVALLNVSGVDPEFVICDKNTKISSSPSKGVSETVAVGGITVTLTLSLCPAAAEPGL